jgi:hypothetical protein
LEIGYSLELGVWELVFRLIRSRKLEIGEMDDLRSAFRQLVKNPGFAAVAHLFSVVELVALKL